MATRLEVLRKNLLNRKISYSQLAQSDRNLLKQDLTSKGVGFRPTPKQVERPIEKPKPTGFTPEQKRLLEQAKTMTPEQAKAGLSKQKSTRDVTPIGAGRLQSEMSPLERAAGTLTRTGAGIVETGVRVPASIAGGLATIAEGVSGGRTDLGLRKVSDPLFKLSEQLGGVKQITPQATSKVEEFAFDTLPSAATDIIAKGSTGVFAPTVYITSAVGNAYESGPKVDKFGNPLTEKQRRDRAAIVGGVTGPIEYLGDKLALTGYTPSVGSKGIIGNITKAALGEKAVGFKGIVKSAGKRILKEGPKGISGIFRDVSKAAIKEGVPAITKGITKQVGRAALGEGASGFSESLFTDLYDINANLSDKANSKIIKDALLSGIEEAIVGGIFQASKISTTLFDSRGNETIAENLTIEEAEQNIERLARELNVSPLTLISEAQKAVGRQTTEVKKAKADAKAAKKEFSDFRNKLKKATTTQADITKRNELADKSRRADDFLQSTKDILTQRKQIRIEQAPLDGRIAQQPSEVVQQPLAEQPIQTIQEQPQVAPETSQSIITEVEKLNTKEELQTRLNTIEERINQEQDEKIRLNLQFFADQIKQKMSRLGVIDTALKSRIISPEIKGELTTRVSPQRSNIKTLESARKIISEGGEDVAFDDYINDRFEDRVVRNAAAIELARKFTQKGDKVKVKQIIKKLALDAKQAGQEGQILSLMSKMDTDGQIIHAQQIIEGVNEEIKAHNQKKTFIPRKDVKKLDIELIDDKQLRKDLDLVNDTFDSNADDLRKFIIENSGITFVNKAVATKLIENMDLEIEQLKAKALATVYKKNIYDKIPKSIGSKLSLSLAIGHLTGSTTFFRNILSNEGSFAMNQFDKKLGRVIDKAKFTGEKRFIGEKLTKEKSKEIKGKAKLKGKEAKLDVLLGIANQMNEMQKYLDTGGASDLGKTSDIERKGTTFTGGKGLKGAPGTVGVAAEKQLAQSLVVPDERMKERVRLTLQEELKTINDGELTQEMKDDADLEAKYVTFQDDSFPATVLKKANEFFGLFGIKGFGLNDFLVKYTRVPGNLIMRKLEYSPTGLAKASIGLKIILNKPDATDAQKRQAIMSLSKGITGTGLFAFGALLRQLDLLVDEDEKGEAVAQLMRDAGLSGMNLNASALKRLFSGEDTSLQPGDKLIRANFLDPFTGVINQGGVWWDFIKGDKGFLATVGKSGKELVDLPSLYTLNRIISESQKVKNAPEEGFGFVDVATIPLTEGLPGFIPNPIRQTAATFDQTTRDSFDGNQWNQAFNRVKQSIPGVSRTLEPAITAQGKEKTRSTDNKVLDFLKTWGPIRVTKFRPLPNLEKLNEISEFEGGTQHLPLRFPPKSIGKGDNKKKLNSKEKSTYMKEYAKGMTQYFQTLQTVSVSKANADTVQKDLGKINLAAKKRAEAKLGILPKPSTSQSVGIPKKLKIIPRIK